MAEEKRCGILMFCLMEKIVWKYLIPIGEGFNWERASYLLQKLEVFLDNRLVVVIASIDGGS